MFANDVDRKPTSSTRSNGSTIAIIIFCAAVSAVTIAVAVNDINEHRRQDAAAKSYNPGSGRLSSWYTWCYPRLESEKDPGILIEYLRKNDPLFPKNSSEWTVSGPLKCKMNEWGIDYKVPRD